MHKMHCACFIVKGWLGAYLICKASLISTGNRGTTVYIALGNSFNNYIFTFCPGIHLVVLVDVLT